jgi:hypothetical protein
MNTRLALVLCIVAIGFCRVTAGAPPSLSESKKPSEPGQMVVRTETGETTGIIEAMNINTTTSNETGRQTLSVLFVPERKLLWVGRPKQRYVAFNNAILGIDTGMDRLIYDRQTNAVENIQEKADFIAAVQNRVQRNEYRETCRTLDLGEVLRGLRGLSPFLEPGQDVRPTRPATVTDVRFQGGRLHVTLVGENKTEVRLTFDSDMNLVTGEINGKPAYPRPSAGVSKPEPTN